MLHTPFDPALAEDDFTTTRNDRQPIATKIKTNRVKLPDILGAIDRLEETILKSPHVPMTGKTIVREEELLEQLDIIRLSLPDILKTSQEILQYKNQIIKEAQEQAQQILADANQRAYQIANELGIIDRAEHEAHQIRQMAIGECEHLRQQTIIDVERMRNHTVQEMDLIRQKMMAECQEIQSGADEYADRVLYKIESQLSDVLQSIRNGRQQLQPKSTNAIENQ